MKKKNKKKVKKLTIQKKTISKKKYNFDNDGTKPINTSYNPKKFT